MFPGTGIAFLGFVRFATWDVNNREPDIIITGNGKVIIKPTPGPGGAKGTKGKNKA